MKNTVNCEFKHQESIEVQYEYYAIFNDKFCSLKGLDSHQLNSGTERNLSLIKTLKPMAVPDDISNLDGTKNLSFVLSNHHLFTEGVIALNNGTKMNLHTGITTNTPYSPTFYFNSEIILLENLNKTEKAVIMDYYKKYIPPYGYNYLKKVDCVIKVQGEFFVPASPNFAVINHQGKINAIKDGKVIEITSEEEVPKNEQYSIRVFCC